MGTGVCNRRMVHQSAWLLLLEARNRKSFKVYQLQSDTNIAAEAGNLLISAPVRTTAKIQKQSGGSIVSRVSKVRP